MCTKNGLRITVQKAYTVLKIKTEEGGLCIVVSTELGFFFFLERNKCFSFTLFEYKTIKEK